MLCRFTKIEGSRVVALDGEMGKVRDFYFDDIEWQVRYLVVDTGVWLPGRKVLIAPRAVDSIDHVLHTVLVSLTRERIRRSPNIDTDKPVSRQHEGELHRYYGYVSYWTQSMSWEVGPISPANSSAPSDLLELQERRLADVATSETHLRSAREVSGYGISALGESAGHVRDFLFDDETWALRYLVLDTGKWLFGRRVLLRQSSIQRVAWAGRCVEVSQLREQVEHGLEFDPDNMPLGDLETLLKHTEKRIARRSE